MKGPILEWEVQASASRDRKNGVSLDGIMPDHGNQVYWHVVIKKNGAEIYATKISEPAKIVWDGLHEDVFTKQ